MLSLCVSAFYYANFVASNNNCKRQYYFCTDLVAGNNINTNLYGVWPELQCCSRILGTGMSLLLGEWTYDFNIKVL